MGGHDDSVDPESDRFLEASLMAITSTMMPPRMMVCIPSVINNANTNV